MFPLEVDASSRLLDTELTNTFLPSIDKEWITGLLILKTLNTDFALLISGSFMRE